RVGPQRGAPAPRSSEPHDPSRRPERPDLPEPGRRGAAVGSGPMRQVSDPAMAPASPVPPPPVPVPGPTSGLESLPLPSAPTFLTDGTGRVLRVNAALLRMAGRDPRQPGAAEGLLF